MPGVKTKYQCNYVNQIKIFNNKLKQWHFYSNYDGMQIRITSNRIYDEERSIVGFLK